MVDLLEVQAHHEQLAVEPEVDEQPDDGGAGEARRGEQPEREHRRPDAVLDGDEGAARHHRDGKTGSHRGCPPPLVTGLDEGGGEPGQGGDGRELPAGVGPVRTPARRPGAQRAPTSTPVEGARPQASDAPMKSATPAWNTPLAPRRSPSAPDDRSRAAKTRL